MKKFIIPFIDVAIVGVVLYFMDAPHWAIFLGAWLAGDSSYIIQLIKLPTPTGRK